jgi:3-oxocholest-4-en-26-oyl-CoA dehydrogenase beta subunit
MDYTLSEDQESLVDLAGMIFGERVTQARLDEVEATDERVDRALWADLAAAGLLGIALGDDLGGLGFGVVETALVCEQLGRVVAPIPFVWTAAATLAIAAHGDADAQALLPDVVNGLSMLTCAVPVGVNATVDCSTMSGVLTAVPYAHVATAVVVPVGDELYLLDPSDPGVSLLTGPMTSREIAGELTLSSAPVRRLGAAAAEWWWQRTVVLLAAVQSGITSAALRLAADYTSTRLQFDKPLSTFQGVAHRAADGYIDNAGIRATMLRAAWQLDRGGDARTDVLTAQWWAAEAGQRCVHATQHIHGGIGADVTYPVHRYFLWGKQIELLVGTASSTLEHLGDLLVELDSPGDAIAV